MLSPRHSWGSQSAKPAVADQNLPNLRICSIPTGTRGDGRDLKRFLYRGAAGKNSRRDVDSRIAKGEFGDPLIERLDLLQAIHARIDDAPIAAHTKLGWFAQISQFIQWVDCRKHGARLTEATAKSHFLEYTDHLRRRVQVMKNMKPSTASSAITMLAQVLGPVLDPNAPFAHRALRELASMPKPKRAKRSRGIQADKQRLDHTFQFGSFLADVCAGLTAEAVRGPLPLDIALTEGGRKLRLASALGNPSLDPHQIVDRARRERALRAREPVPPTVDVRDARSSLINFRIRAEILIFIAQTGMNLAQTKDLPRADYRWQSDDEDYIVRAVYKGRRQGVAKFIVFRAYRDHLARYLAWLDELGLSQADDRLFPCLYPVDVPPAHAPPSFDSVRRRCKMLSIPYVCPRDLRNTRTNWLLRRSRDPDLTAEMSAHTKETLLRVYEEGDLQSASQEIGAYHAKTDPALSQSRSVPVCLKNDDMPRPLPDIPKGAPQPDCVTPEGCLWCEHLRDVLAPNYCWRLASHRYLKSLEVSLFRPPASQPVHPGYLVIDRLNLKLKAIAERSALCSEWVTEAKNKVREGHYHPRWASVITILEDLV